MKVLCIDVGGSFLKYTALEEELYITQVNRIETPKKSLNLFLQKIQEIYRQYPGVDGIAVSTPGVVDTDSGFMYTGGSLHYIRNIPMEKEISRLCGGLPVSIENDAKAAAAAELYAGALSDVKNGVILTLGTAVGGTIIIDRKILRGKNLFAGEMSYAIYQDNGARDEQEWDLEENMWGFRCVPSQIVRGYGKEEMQCEDIFQRLAEGDLKAEQAVRAAARDAALFSHNIQCMFDPDKIAFGGGISAEPVYIQMIREEAGKINQLFHGVVPMPRIEACRFFNNANLIGAYFAFQNRNGNCLWKKKAMLEWKK